ncbi:MAG TPA: pectinesterase family protein [Bacteroidota bacterium]|nr:pectinesterase family protein [Bacteroidota bacterium]
MKHRILSLLGLIVCSLTFARSVSAQSATAVWPLTQAAGTTVQVTGAIQATDERLSKDLLINGYTGPGTSQRIKMNAWPVNQLVQLDTIFIQYSVQPQTSYKLRIDSVTLNLGANSTQDMMANLYYSKDSTFAVKTPVSYKTSVAARLGKPEGVFLNSSKLDTIRFAPNVMLEANERFYFRIYPWVDSSASVSGKYICPQAVTVYATAIAVPVSAVALWPLMTNELPIVSGLITGDAVSYAGGLKKYGFNANGDRWTTPDGSWPAESTPNFARYAQLAVAPKVGGTFYASSVKFTQVVEFTTSLRVALYYSNDSTFATKTFIADTTAPAAKTTYEYAINDTVKTGEKLYLRFYPYDTKADPAWKLIDVDSIFISGATTGLAILAPSVSTTAASYISTTFFTSGGVVTADGGGALSARGVCWDTVSAPVASKWHTSDGTGIGTFSSQVTGLAAGKTYYVRAYATNAGGTGYGSEITVSTLAAITAPTVTTTSVTSILVKTATGGGTVKAWGGAPVTARGICWSTKADPTVADSKSVDGSDIGTFTSALTNLSPNTLYHVRAYAVNSAGTGYGADSSFTTRTPQADTTVVVAKNGSGNYTTVQAAFRAVPVGYTGKWTIFVKKGVYYEKDTLASGKVNVSLIGEDRDSTIITYDDYADHAGSGNPGTSGSFTIAIDASDFTAKNITFRNTYAPQPGVSGTQAVALRTQGDRHEYINCNMLGYQDTYYTWGGSGTGRMYHKNCLIEGTVDFIFGRNICVFDSCTIREIRNGGTLTAAATDASTLYGYVFRNCVIRADSIGYDGVAITSFHLGRPWQNAPRTVFLRSKEPWNLNAAGWLAWNVAPGLYAEYRCTGAGAATTGRPTWSSQLSDTAAAKYSLQNMFAKSSANSSLILYDWMPANATSADNMPIVTDVERSDVASSQAPTEFSLSQNYPNPFNPSTTIQFAVPARSRVSIEIFNTLGQLVATVANGEYQPGAHRVVWNARTASGMYLYRITAVSAADPSQRFVQARKLLLLK